MATESAGIQFFKHDYYTPSYYAIYIALETWIAKAVLRNDLSRIFLASDDYAFRRRHELTNLSDNFNDLAFKSLNTPFANYWPLNTGWAPDQRVAANHARLLYTGISGLGRMIRAMMVTNTIPVTFYYAREDDARMAYEDLLWISFREQLIYTTVDWEDETLEIPVNIKVQGLQFNPDYTEIDWLKENRLFIVRAEMEVRSSIIAPLVQPDYDSSDQIALADNQSFLLTEESILQFYNESNLEKEISIDSLFTENGTILVNQATILGASPTSVRVFWDIETDGSDLETITIQIQGQEPILLAAPDLVSEYVIRDLENNSDYIVNVTFRLENGSTKTVSMQFSTSILAENLDEVVASTSTVVGTSW